MKNIAYFENIHLVIIDYIKNAQNQVLIAVAWFSDKDIYEALLSKKKKDNITVKIILANHEFNQKGVIDFGSLIKLGGTIDLIGENGNNKTRLMHNKFCLIDNNIVINGSFNWSYKARLNDENIVVIEDDFLLFNQFLNKFEEINPKQQLSVSSNGEVVIIDRIVEKWQQKSVLSINSFEKTLNNISSKF